MLLLIQCSTSLVADAFSDAGGSQYKTSIDALEARKLIQGYADGTFRPFNNINRAEFVKLILGAVNVTPTNVAGGCFKDIKDEWYAPYVCKASQMGLIQGYPDGTFKPGQSINMVEAEKIVAQAFELSIRPVAAGEQWFEPYVDFYHDNTLFSKFSYWPERPLRREEMAFLIDQMVQFHEGTRLMTSVRNVGSPGCGKKAPATPITSFNVNGGTQNAINYIPRTYDATKPTPLIFAFHGRTNSNTQVRSYYGLERAGAAQNAIILYPEGNKVGSSYNWNGSYALFDTMLRDMKNSYCINVDEVYVVGHSLGAWAANDLACARADQIRAVGSLGGGRSENKCTGPVAAMIWHNPKDSLAPFSGGEHARDLFLAQNRTTKDNDPTEPAWGNCVKYRGGHETSPVVWCPHNIDHERDGTYYTHVWPSGTGQAMWDFFQSLPD